MDKNEIEGNHSIHFIAYIFLDNRNQTQFNASGDYLGSNLIVPLQLKLLMTGGRIHLTDLPQFIPVIIDLFRIHALQSWFYFTR